MWSRGLAKQVSFTLMSECAQFHLERSKPIPNELQLAFMSYFEMLGERKEMQINRELQW